MASPGSYGSPDFLDAAVSSALLLGLVPLIFLLRKLPIFSMGFRSGELAGQSSTVMARGIKPGFGASGGIGRDQVLLEDEICIHTDPQQKES